MDCIFVSAYIAIDTYKLQDEYMKNGKCLLNNNLCQIIFLEKDILKNYYSYFLENEDDLNTVNYIKLCDELYSYIKKNNKYFIFYDKSKIYLEKYKSKINNFCLNTPNPKKDTINYMFIQCNKTEWMRLAIDFSKKIKINKNTEYIWIDFGIYHILRDESKLTQILNKINEYCKYNKNYSVKIPSIWHPGQILSSGYIFEEEIYKTIMWFFAGGLFGGTELCLIKFADKVKAKCIEIIETKNTIMWEVNIWTMIYNEDPTIFIPYENCLHDSSMIENYVL